MYVIQAATFECFDRIVFSLIRQLPSSLADSLPGVATGGM